MSHQYKGSDATHRNTSSVSLLHAHRPSDGAPYRPATTSDFPLQQFSTARKPLPNRPAVKLESQNTSSRSKPSRSKRGKQLSSWPLRIFQNWWLELLCCFLTIGALLAIMATVLPYEGRPLPNWPYNLSINSLISIYVVILKAAMSVVLAEGLGQLKWTWFRKTRPLTDIARFDEASRGSIWGSILLLFSLNLR